MDIEQDLRLTSDELLRILERLQQLEYEKRTLTPGSARFRRIAREIERLAAGVLNKTVEQEQLATESAVLREEAGVISPPIEQITPKRELQLILSEWREAERRLLATSQGSAEHTEALAAVQRLRVEYRDASRPADGEGERTS